MKNNFCSLVSLLAAALMLLAMAPAGAQIELTNSLDFGMPELQNNYNKNYYYNQFTFGTGFGVSYKPANTQFFPTLKASLGRTRLPLTQFGDNQTIALNFNYLNTILYGNLVARFGEHFNTLYFMTGIGFSRMVNKGIFLTGNSANNERAYFDSTKNIDQYFPVVAAGAEYVFGVNDDKPAYICFGFNLQYIILLDQRNNYFVGINEPQYNQVHTSAFLEGGVIAPTVYMCIHYIFSRNAFHGMADLFKKDK